MRIIKLVGLVAIAATAIMAFAGVGSASATTLCEENVGKTECPLVARVPLPTTMAAYAAPLQLSLGGVPVTTCSSSEMRIAAEKNLGAGKGISGQATKFSVAGCGNLVGCPPNPEARNLPYKAEIQETTGGNGTLTLSSGGSGNPTLRFTGCSDSSGGHNATCTFSAEKIELGFAGATNPKTITASNEALTAAPGTGCQVGGVEISATYGVQDLSFSPNSGGQVQLLDGSGVTQFKCASQMTGSLAGTITNQTYSGCGTACTSAKALGLPYTTSYTGGAESGTVTVNGFRWEISGCPFGITCRYASEGSLSLDVEGSKVIANKEPLKMENPALCGSLLPASGFLSGSFPKSGTILALASSP